MKISVKIFEGEKEITSKVWGEGVYRLGRSDFSDVMLDHPSISRSHLEIRMTANAVYATNMAPAGRLKRNGFPVEAVQVSDGDELLLGPYRVVIQFQQGDESNEPPSAAEEGVAENAEAPLPEMPESPMMAESAPEPEPAPAMQPEESSFVQLKTEIEIKPVIAKILFLEGPRAGEEILLESYEASIGRSQKADIFIDDEKLSRIHAKIARVGMGYRLIDLNSRNGTFVNGVRILEHPLSSFDRIELGHSKIRFLIHDLLMGDLGRAPLAKVEGAAGEMTHSVQVSSGEPAMVPAGAKSRFQLPSAAKLRGMSPRRRNILLGACLALLLVLYFAMSGKEAQQSIDAEKERAQASISKTNPNIPKEFLELTAESQRTVEGYYNMAAHLAEKQSYEEALAYLKRIHESIPFYKNSRELADQITRKLKDLQIERAKADAQRNEKRDLALYLEDGLEYLKEGDFGRAEEAFHSALLVDPENKTAIRGLKAVEQKVRRLEDIAPEVDPEQEKRKQVMALFEQALSAFNEKSYARTIQIAEDIRKIELKGDTQYLSEAKQLIDKAKLLQKDQFEPFLIQAKEKFVEGDFNAVRDLCGEMLKQDPTYQEAAELQKKALKQLNNLAKEAYTQGYILESMNRLEEAKQNWNRAKNYVRPGDPYYDKVIRKLEQYQ